MSFQTEKIEDNHQYFDNLVTQNQIDPKIIEVFQVEINEFLEQHLSCSAQTSFKNCKQMIKGYEKILVFENGQFYSKMVPCAHLAKQLEKDKFLERFYFVNFDLEPTKLTNFLFFKNNIKKQRDFYFLDETENWNEISEFIADKNEFKNKAVIVKNFLAIMEGKTADNRGLYLVGTMGVGKTNLLKFLALIAANNYKKTVGFTNVNHLVNKLKEGFDDKEVNTNKFLTELSNVDLLVLDDIGSEQATKWVRDEVLFSLLNHRMEMGKLTYFTSNLTLEELEKQYLQMNERDPNKKIKTSRLIERIKTMSREFALIGQDHRLLK